MIRDKINSVENLNDVIKDIKLDIIIIWGIFSYQIHSIVYSYFILNGKLI